MIEARVFRVIGRGGTVAAAMTFDGFSYRGLSDETSASMGVFGVYVGNPDSRAHVNLTGGHLWVADENGNTRAVMNADGFSYSDENEATRVRLGRASLRTIATDAETTYPAAVVLFNDEGDVIWQAPQ